MRTSQLYWVTSKEAPAHAEIISHQLMLRAGFIRRVASGIYTWLPLGIRVLRKVEAVVREEMNQLGAQECLMPMIQPAELWQSTERWQAYGPELLRLQDRHQRSFCLGPTHEEVITDLIKNQINSYKQLPIILYQIQTKFRDEIRPRFGIMRAREFIMKDAYSFHADQASLEKTYEAMYHAYINIFKRLGLQVKAVKADVGSIGGHTSHEFQLLADVGEDVIMYDENSDYAVNQELISKDLTDNADMILAQKNLKSARGIEVGHIFQLGTKYSQQMQAKVAIQTGELQAVEMGCYGIGISRIVAAAIEQHHDPLGICWPHAMAPFQVAIIPIGYSQSTAIRAFADRLYQQLKTLGIDSLLDDRSIRPGVAFSEMDLIGIPHRIVMSESGLSRNQIEYKARKGSSQWFSMEDLFNFLKRTL